MDKIYTRKINETNMYVTSERSIERELWEYFSFQVPGYKFTPQYKKGGWDGYVRLLNLNTKMLYIGLRFQLQRFADENGLEVIDEVPVLGTVEFTRPQVSQWLDDDPNTVHGRPVELRDYQREAIIKAIVNKRIIIESPTGSGKSLILFKICKFLQLAGKRILLQVPSTMLVEQMYKDFQDYATGTDFDVETTTQRVYAKFDRVVAKPIVISTWQTQHSTTKKTNKVAYMDQFDVVLQDECLAGDTLIKTPSGYTAIKDIKVGDKIINFCEKDCVFKEDEVVKVHKNLTHSLQEKMLELVMDTGDVIQVTANHKFLTTDGWVRADCLDENHQIISTSI